MSGLKNPKKIYQRRYTLDWSTVIGAIIECEKFHWSWFEQLTGVHHTGIVFYLDYQARFTVNWTPKNGTKRIGSLVAEIEGQLVFEDEVLKLIDDPDYKVDYKPFIEEYDMLCLLHAEDDAALKVFFEKIERLVNFKFQKYENKSGCGATRFYDISSCNCRDHVEAVIRDVLNVGDPHLIKVLTDLQEIRCRPVELLLYRVAAFKGRFVTAFGGIFELFTSARAFQRHNAKANGPFLDLSELKRRFLSLCEENTE